MTQFYFLQRKQTEQQRKKNEMRAEEEERGTSARMRTESNEG